MRDTAALYRAHGGEVLRYAIHVLGSKEEAEDASQGTFLAVHAALTRGTVVREPRGWVLRIARHECLDRIAARRPAPGVLDEVDVASPWPGVERTAELRAEVATAQRVLARLPQGQREAFVLREWLGLSPVEVAYALDRLRRVRRRPAAPGAARARSRASATSRPPAAAHADALTDGRLDRSRAPTCCAAAAAVPPAVGSRRRRSPWRTIAPSLRASAP